MYGLHKVIYDSGLPCMDLVNIIVRYKFELEKPEAFEAWKDHLHETNECFKGIIESFWHPQHWELDEFDLFRCIVDEYDYRFPDRDADYTVHKFAAMFFECHK